MESDGYFCYQDFKQKYNLDINFCIPKQWDLSTSAKLKPIEIKQNMLKKIIAAPKVCKLVYQNLVECVIIKRGHKSKWDLVLDVSRKENKWRKVYSVSFEGCVESSLRAFQCGILLYPEQY